MSTPKVTSILLVALILLSVLNFLLKYYTYFFLVVANANLPDTPESESVPGTKELYVPFLTFIPTVSPVLLQPWVLITSGLVDHEFLVPCVLVVFSLGKFLEAKWGPREFLKYIVVVLCGSNVMIYLYFVVQKALFGISGDIPVVSTSAALCMGLLVATKQRLSNHYMILFSGNLRLKVAHLPFYLTALAGVCAFFSFQYRVIYMLCVVGFGVSWLYLRYIKSSSNERQSYLLPMRQRRSVSGPNSLAFDDRMVKGDRSNLFALHTFFPAPLSHFVARVGSFFFDIMVQCHWVAPKDYTTEEVEVTEDIAILQTKLFSLSQLKGAQEISAIPSSRIRGLWRWFSKENTPVETSIDARRKLAIREFE